MSATFALLLRGPACSEPSACEGEHRVGNRDMPPQSARISHDNLALARSKSPRSPAVAVRDRQVASPSQPHARRDKILLASAARLLDKRLTRDALLTPHGEQLGLVGCYAPGERDAASAALKEAASVRVVVDPRCLPDRVRTERSGVLPQRLVNALLTAGLVR